MDQISQERPLQSSARVRRSHWQKGLFDHILRSAESCEEKWHYVRENPVRANLVSNWEDWPYRGEPERLEYRKL